MRATEKGANYRTVEYMASTSENGTLEHQIKELERRRFIVFWGDVVGEMMNKGVSPHLWPRRVAESELAGGS